jgi:hypothetical protein
MAKTFSENEHKILEMLKMCKSFEYDGKMYDIKILGKPGTKKGEPKTDIYIYAESNTDSLEFKISFKQKNFEFLENKISSVRAEEIFGKSWSTIISNSLKAKESAFNKRKLIFKNKKGKTDKGAFTLGWKFELLNVASGDLSGEIILTKEQLKDIYAGTNLDNDKKNALVNGITINNSGIANCILIDDQYNSVEDMLSKIISMDDYVNEHSKMYFACKALNYRSFRKKYDGNRPLSVFVNWSIENGKLSGRINTSEPLKHSGNEVFYNLISCLNKLNINTTDDLNINNTIGDIIYEEI